VSWWRDLLGRKQAEGAPLPELNSGLRQQFRTVSWQVPWIAIDDLDQAAWLKGELARELPTDHVLFGRDAEFLAKRQDRDDFFVALEQGEAASVHLTWSIETDPNWPGTSLYPSFKAWLEAEMLPDSEEWEAAEREYRNSLS
jgi:hypothetical protein